MIDSMIKTLKMQNTYIEIYMSYCYKHPTFMTYQTKNK